MQELRLVGVHEDGEHLLLSGGGGASFTLPIDEALRTASSRKGTRAAPRASSGSGAVRMTPRDIQSRIRSGSTAEDIVNESGLDLAHVLRYEGPVRAERDYVALLARRVEVSSPLPSQETNRSSFAEHPAQLGEMVDHRLQAYGVDPNSADWDAWRRPDGQWNIVATFDLGAGSQVSVGEEPPAQWIFSPARKTIQNANRWAQVLSELEPLDGPLPARRLTAVADRVFDFDAVKDDGQPDATGLHGRAESDDSDNLLDVLRSRRGQRLGLDEDADDALALMLSKGGVPAAHPRDGSGEMEAEPADEESSGQRIFTGLSLAPAVQNGDEGPSGLEDNDLLDAPAQYSDGTPRLFDGVSTDTREISIFVRPPGGSANGPRPAKQAEPAPGGSKGTDLQPDRKVRPRRSSVPSWDEIVFGTKSD